jgi:Zn-dependent alcohol dehydrogenase
MLQRLHEEGRLELDRLVTRRYSLEQLTEGYRDQAAGETVRGLLVHGS